MKTIAPLSSLYNQEIINKINDKTKPLGALGNLEPLAAQFARITYQQRNIDLIHRSLPELSVSEQLAQDLTISKPTLIVFAGDHGVGAQGVSIAPSEVTGQMVENFAKGGAAINVFCKQLGWRLAVIDTGILQPPAPELGIINQRLGAGTKAFNTEQAMSMNCVTRGFEFADTLICEAKQQGTNLIAFGEMGIANTTSAAAIMSILMDLPACETVGKGTGVSEDIVLKKQRIVEQAIQLHLGSILKAKSDSDEAYVKQILACVGGYEVVQLTAAMLSAAKNNMMILIDGFICTAAAMLAVHINKNVKDYMVFAHTSGEQGHQKMLAWLDANPLLNLGLRLGEGTGAALALPLVQAAVAFYNYMASFSQAEVTDVVTPTAVKNVSGEDVTQSDNTPSPLSDAEQPHSFT